MKPNTGEFDDPDVVADMWYNVFINKKGGEDVYPEGVTPSTVKF
ncbi:hypothetical protein [Cytobacillus purgationiresistens]|uniref:Uncharacterized protein n=1 Tax=Cytobacillus purgationiresistens TaxID=863449 RepID=A0ABU0AH89_9BACI|nr:hypothetical protein [Cytobacillus purgationiresistens]MDQ0270624.1 hypothetical protein [Cytobacillus purgationiresistens]